VRDDEPRAHHLPPRGLSETQSEQGRPPVTVARVCSHLHLPGAAERRCGRPLPRLLIAALQTRPEKGPDYWQSPYTHIPQGEAGGGLQVIRSLPRFNCWIPRDPTARRLEAEGAGPRRAAWSGVTCWK
jgi:hypothetical protein